MPTFTRTAANGVVCKKNWFQETDGLTLTYPYMFDVTGIGIIVIHATELTIAHDYANELFPDETVKLVYS